MVTLAQLWMPILISTVLVFVASALFNMVLKFWHTPDYSGFANEDEVRAAIGKCGTGPAMFLVPYCKPEDMKKPEMQKKYAEGPVAFVMLRASGPMSMGGSLGTWFVFCLLVSIFAGYLAGATLAPGTAGAQVFRVVAVAALLGHAFGAIPNGIWWAHPWKSVVKYFIDGTIYALIVAAIFACCWPT
jgi:hypothetical protein